MDAAARRASKKKSSESLKSKGYVRHGDVYFKPSKEGSFRGSYKEIASDGSIRSVAPYAKEYAMAKIAKKLGKAYTPKQLR